MRRAWWLLLALAACKADLAANPAPRCETPADCPPGREECYRNFCIPPHCDADEPCYGGPPGTAGVGICRAGVMRCVNGRLGACEGEVLPLNGELCINDDDDNCNGQTNEFEAVCDTGLQGVCGSGTRSGCGEPCVQTTLASDEVCNNLDDDCDGDLDEDLVEVCYPDLTAGCAPSAGGYTCAGVCAPGERRCVAGDMGACEGAVVPSQEPDGCTPMGQTARDDDCDGDIDEDCECTPGIMQECYNGPDATQNRGTCVPGQQLCETSTSGASRFGSCIGDVVPEPETCLNDAADNDCNDVVDDVPMRNTACTDASRMGVCSMGLRLCRGGGPNLTCVTTASSAESCNMLDDDCDGPTDEGFDLLNDPLNCGECSRRCNDGLTCCSGECVDLTADDAHCGSCPNDCDPDEDCCGGRCFATATSTTHCGMCGESCNPGQSCCASECVDTRTDEDHCNGCGQACTNAGDQCCMSTCASPQSSACQGCVPACTGPGELCCSGTCVETQFNRLACGSCTNQCTGTDICCNGQCVPNNEDHCGPSCTECGMNELCCNSACVPNNAMNCNMCGQLCANTCCPDGCVNTNNDPTHCGNCTNQCNGTDICLSGRCCPAGATLCNGNCCTGICLGIGCVL